MVRKVLTYRDVEEARKMLGKRGWFSNSIECVERGHSVGSNTFVESTLIAVYDHGYVFLPNASTATYQFFSPDPEPVERWVPFMAEDWPKIIGAVFKHKGIGYPFPIFVPVGVANDGVAYAKNGGIAVISFQDFLDNMECTDGTPCGKKITE